ncbi:hypothetical protein ATE92_2306 [Ulvibacter sp. MAR_2010_11]|nr:hypothetical protein [Ulvibacter sp. MAR_2010_11]PKA84136.1 hypothetical protein ATE92_2306 [Ulvibacter sp. MAR_2010_11]
MKTLRNIQKIRKMALDKRSKVLHFTTNVHNMHEDAMPIRIKYDVL